MANRYFVDALPAGAGARTDPPIGEQSGEHELTGDTAHHLSKVLRVAPGDEVVLADGRGGQCTATVRRVRGRSVTVALSQVHHVAERLPRVHIAFAPPRLTRADWLFEHGTEAGAAVFWPLWTQRTRPQGDRLERWQKIVRAAAGQCDRAWLPSIRPPMEMREFAMRPDLPARRLLATEAAPALQPGATAETLLLVGPEGGLADDEQALCIELGFAPVGLGPHVLRTETAALLGIGMLALRD